MRTSFFLSDSLSHFFNLFYYNFFPFITQPAGRNLIKKPSRRGLPDGMEKRRKMKKAPRNQNKYANEKACIKCSAELDRIAPQRGATKKGGKHIRFHIKPFAVRAGFVIKPSPSPFVRFGDVKRK